MKKTLLACALLGSLAATSAQASTLVGFKVGGDYWQADTSGTFAESGQPQQDFDYSSSSQGSIWVAVEHPIPLVPNVKIRENRLDDNGSATVDGFEFGGTTFDGAVSTSTNLSNTDFVLYYELLDNDLVALDLGAAYKKMHGSLRVNHTETQGRVSAEKDLDSGIVMAYADAQVGVPGLGLYGFAEVMLGVDETSVYDYSVGLGWQFDGVALDTKVRLGYRDFSFDVNDFDGVSTNSQFKGYFAGVELVF
ncbi:TIGR04219 family outer membrane beta-barrel protein [Shewanella nanhaiensis]|uniref:TIGR04219 family outer membrane beta-barrel protein n=1 Tax=Shewanella nanhaiensis TaxID=2864872 RepID=A0ABS7DZ08_9GAMM|nr:TIGR04219 family outer membrane beta-barrel protein [Shewanella nanhaiensis]MBW8182647.1 TIGR04219 family outer membrane beta-barrel protein [Shewanella nanhaiensis]